MVGPYLILAVHFFYLDSVLEYTWSHDDMESMGGMVPRYVPTHSYLLRNFNQGLYASYCVDTCTYLMFLIRCDFVMCAESIISNRLFLYISSVQTKVSLNNFGGDGVVIW